MTCKRAYLHQLFGIIAVAEGDLRGAHEALLAGIRGYSAQGHRHQLVGGIEMESERPRPAAATLTQRQPAVVKLIADIGVASQHYGG